MRPRIKTTYLLTTTILFLLLYLNPAICLSQENQIAKAIQLFDNGKFTEAEPLFKDLLKERPNHFMLNYYYGACRTENGNYETDDLQKLIFSADKVSTSKINYYLGIQHHARNNWVQALKFYTKYKLKATLSEQNDVNLAEKTQQCFDKVNLFTVVSEIKEKKQLTPETGDELTDVEQSQNDETLPRPALAEEVQKEDTILRTKENLPDQDNFLEEYQEITTKKETAKKSDKKEVHVLMELDTGTKQLPNEVVQVENESNLTEYELGNDKAKTVRKVVSTAEFAAPVSELIGSGEKEKGESDKKTIAPVDHGHSIVFIINNEITYLNSNNFRTKEGKDFYTKAGAKQKELDTSLKEIDKLRKIYNWVTTREEKDKIGQQILPLESKSYTLKEEITQLFLQSKTSENKYWQNATSQEREKFISWIESSSENKVIDRGERSTFVHPNLLFLNPNGNKETQKGVKEELIYKIQIGAYSRGLPSYVKRLYQKLSVLRKIENYTDDHGVVVYTTGNLTNLNDALKMQAQVRQEGVEDAHVVPYFNGKRITLDQAKELEAEK